MTTRKPSTNEATIRVDTEGTELGRFDDRNTPIVSYQQHTGEWMLAHKTPTGTNCLALDVHGSDTDALNKAVAAARQHLHANQTKAAEGNQ